MTAKIIDGKKIATDIKEELKNEVTDLKNKGVVPGLAVVLVGDDAASRIYVASKKKACKEVGIYSESYELAEDVSRKELLGLIEKLNNDTKINGILVQLPLPKHLDEKVVINSISPEKDVDCFHPENVGQVMIGRPKFLPCTPAGVIEILKRKNVKISGADCVVVGKSNIVGKPTAMMLLNAGATVTVCHSKTADLASHCKNADILAIAAGYPGLITASMVKKGAVVIDVGINRNADGKLTGDVDFEDVSALASLITPVPGGVGPMTIAMLMKNTITAAKNNL